MLANFRGNVHMLSLSEPRAPILMSSLNNLQQAHTFLSTQAVVNIEPMFSLCSFSVKQFHPEEKLVIVFGMTISSLKTCNNASSITLHESWLLLHPQEAARGNPRTYFSTW